MADTDIATARSFRAVDRDRRTRPSWSAAAEPSSLLTVLGEVAQLLPGTLDLLILKAVSLAPAHGYGILLRIAQISGGALAIEQGALYPALALPPGPQLLDTKWGTSDNKRHAPFYRLPACRKRARPA